jgi:AcrR family transcriptional regulator
MRRKDQAERRRQIVRAAREVLLRRGAVGVRVKDIAAGAGMAPSTLLYYYPELDELLLEVSRGAISRYTEVRTAEVNRIEDAAGKLLAAIRLGIPTGPGDDESRLLYELDAFTGSSPAFAVLSAAYFDRQVALYSAILSAGVASGEFTLQAPAERIGAGLVALEDGLGLQVVLGHPGIDAEEAERILLAYASAMTGLELSAAEAPGRPVHP